MFSAGVHSVRQRGHFFETEGWLLRKSMRQVRPKMCWQPTMLIIRTAGSDPVYGSRQMGHSWEEHVIGVVCIFKNLWTRIETISWARNWVEWVIVIFSWRKRRVIDLPRLQSQKVAQSTDEFHYLQWIVSHNQFRNCDSAVQITAWEEVRRGKSTLASQRRWVSGSYPFDDIISLLHRVNINLYYLECSSIAIGKMEYSKSPVSTSWYLCMICLT